LQIPFAAGLEEIIDISESTSPTESIAEAFGYTCSVCRRVYEKSHRDDHGDFVGREN
jgi:hypothetical protein